jgi:hypothetical protein
MGLKKNVFDPILFEFLDTLRGLLLAGHVADTQSQNNRTLLNQALEEARLATSEPIAPDQPAIGTTYSLLVPNFFEGAFLSYGRSRCQDAEMLRLVTELSRRFQATTICMVYEAVERFLKKFAPPLFFAARDGLDLEQRAEFHKRKRDFAKGEARGCYALSKNKFLSMRTANASQCQPARVSASRS